MERNDLSPGARLAIGLALCAAGLALGAYGLLDPAAEIMPDRFIAAPLGLVAFSAGVLLAFPGAGLKLKSVFGTLLVTAMGVAISWIAFGPGERHFSGSISIPGLSVGGGSGELSGRIAFGIGAVLIDAFALFSWVRLVKLFAAPEVIRDPSDLPPSQ